MAMADDGELIVLAPGLHQFGEDKQIDALIRKYGYVGTDKVLQLVQDNEDLRGHLLHLQLRPRPLVHQRPIQIECKPW